MIALAISDDFEYFSDDNIHKLYYESLVCVLNQLYNIQELNIFYQELTIDNNERTVSESETDITMTLRSLLPLAVHQKVPNSAFGK